MIKNPKFGLLKLFGKILPVFMLGAILFVSARYLVFTSIVKFHKREFRQIILKQDHKNIQQLFVSCEDLYQDLNGLEWKENNKEVVINNQYHEVLSVVKKGKGFLVSIIADDLENNLFSHFFKSNNTGKKLADYLLLAFSFNCALTPGSELKAPTATFVNYKSSPDPADQSGFIAAATKPPCGIHVLRV